jgi:hypothetical protein
MVVYILLKIYLSIVEISPFFTVPSLVYQKSTAMKVSKDPNVIGRKYNGHPHLKLKMVRQSSHHQIRQLLRGFAPLDELRMRQRSENNSE